MNSPSRNAGVAENEHSLITINGVVARRKGQDHRGDMEWPAKVIKG